MSSKKPHDLIALFDKMILKIVTGKKLLPNGKRHSEGSINNYKCLRKMLYDFSSKYNFELHITDIRRLPHRKLVVQKNYWKKFYLKFTTYMYKDLNSFDNFVGSQMKLLRAFFRYLEKDQLIYTGVFYKDFYVRSEQIPVIAFTPEQFHFLIYNQEFENKLSPHLRAVKDIFVVGCTAALRYSDLMKLTRANLISTEQNTYLSTRSLKTKTFTRVKLPDYAINILGKYELKNTALLPYIDKGRVNSGLKLIAEIAGWTEPIKKYREKRGKPQEIKKENSSYRFCDLISSHTMRRTGITTMLTLGVPEHIVRSVSGHAAGSKEFFKYVAIAQMYKDRELDQMYNKLKSFPAKDVV